MSKNISDDLQLVELAKANDQVAYEKLLNKYHKSVYYMLLKMVKNADDAEDLTQEAFAKAFSSLDKFNSQYAFSTWLFRIATNNCIDHIRKKRVSTVSIDNPYENDEGDSMRFDIRDTGLTPTEKILKQQREEYLRIAVEKLPVKYRQLVELRYFQELSYEEVAEELDLPLGTVKAQLFRARELLNTILKDMWDSM
ncbi:MAG: sigma-70 family RNA polymerase sigma factor [Bacteroidia bacterium]|nr:sigma-70 family RNA polymerase sigma factor [Bacteroidia bacterium]